MATLNINGKRVKVSDDFLRMTPEQQNAAVEEIAGQIGGQQPGNAAPSPVMDEALAAGSQASQRFAGYTPAGAQAPGRPDLMGATAAALGGVVQGIPVLGPMLQNTSDAIVGTGAQLTGGNYGETVEGLRARRAELAAANPISDIGGQVLGGIGAMGGVAALPGGAAALGMTGNLGARVANSAISSGGLSAADAMIKGGGVEGGLTAGAIGAGLGGGIPLIGAGLKAGARAIGNQMAPIINSIRNPTGEAARRVGMAVTRDVTANPGMVMSQADEAVARQSGMPLINVDKGGETTRALARSVANQSPEARAVIQRTVDDRFSTQAPRAVDFIKRLTGGNVDDLAYQQQIQNTARMVNKPRYDAAYNSPQARAIWTPEIRNLMQAKPFQVAINAAEDTATNAAAVGGGKAIKNPFQFMPDGGVTLRTMPDGSRALPNLEFWDIVQRNLRTQADMANQGGNRLLASQIREMRSQLLGTLDSAVPQFQMARQGAAAFFGADDALEAGKKFATQPRAIPEATAAFTNFTGSEKEAFATGYASELIDRIKAAGDRRNIIQQMFGSPAAREMNELVFGVGKSRQLEAFVRVEALADQLRGAMGNSTTARQLMELGIGGVGGFAMTGDWQGALTGAALAKGARYMGQKVDAKVMEEVARLLTSDNPQALQRAVANATMSPQWMLALDQLQMALAVPARGAAVTMASGQN